jgi:hypothetical protein
LSIDVVLARLLIAAAAGLLLLGATAAWSASNALKKLVGLAIAWLGALAACAALSAPEMVTVAGGATGLAYLIIGAAISVRLHERFGSAETPDIDAADAADEAGEPRT